MAKDKCGTCFYWLKAPSIPMLNQPSDGACRFMPPGLVYFKTLHFPYPWARGSV